MTGVMKHRGEHVQTEEPIAFTTFSQVSTEEASASNVGFVFCQTITCAYRFLPDLIKGDLDSIREDVKAYYLSKV